MSMPMPGADHKSTIVNKLGEDAPRFQLSMANLTKKGPEAIYLVRRLEADLFDFAKDPKMAHDEIPRPREPIISDNLSAEEAKEKLDNYYKSLDQYYLALSALRMKVPIADRFAIEQYIFPFWEAINATSAVKAMRFKALTKNVEEPNPGLFGTKIGRSG